MASVCVFASYGSWRRDGRERGRHASVSREQRSELGRSDWLALDRGLVLFFTG